MNQPKFPTWKAAASMVSMALLTFVSSASATLTVTTENQQGTAGVWPFTPSWTVNTNNSLIAGVAPSKSLGNFSMELAGRDVGSLTMNTNLQIRIVQPSTSTDTNYVTCGNGSSSGSLIVYTLPASANGYNLTNITVFGGWANSGRDAQAYTVMYSTVADPASFKYLTTVNYNPTVGGNTASANRETINDSLGGVIAANVAALQFDFTIPNVENGYVGYAAITVGGTAAATVAAPVLSVTTANQSGTGPYTPTWTAETPNLIAGVTPSTASGNFTAEGSGGTPILTDGTIGQSGTISGFATCGTSGGTVLIYTLTNVVNGTDVTNLVLYSGWGNGNRDAQYFDLSYSTIAAPTVYIPVTRVYYNPQGVVGASANRVALAMNNGTPIVSGAARLKFDFSSPPNASQVDNAYSGFSEIIVQGTDSIAVPPPVLSENTLPSYAETVVGDSVTFTAVFTNTPAVNLQWQVITTNGVAATNDIPGATTGTLVLNNVQLTTAATFYQLKASLVSDSTKVSYSTPALLVVDSVPAAVNGIIVKNATQRGLGIAGTSTNFYPTWNIDTNSDLFYGVGFSAVGTGAFGDSTTGSDPTLLTDGAIGYFSYWPNVGGSPTLVTCGDNRGKSVTYDLPAATYGYDITNITVYGGWGDAGRDELKYEVFYSVDGTTFFSLIVADNNPANVPANTQSATRSMLVPASTNGLVRNVAKLKFNFATSSENFYSGYAEIVVGGKPSPSIPTLAQDISTLTAVTVAGDQLTLTATFNGATSYHWQKNGTNLVDGAGIAGATTTTLRLSNLQVTDTATNGGYRLAGINSSGSAYSAPCALTVNPVPAATNNVVVAVASQLYLHHVSYTPDWTVDTSLGNLIYQMLPSTTNGNFNLEPFGTSRDISSLTDGGALTVDFVDNGNDPSTSSGNYVTCGNGSGLSDLARNTLPAGSTVVYTLPASANGYSLTNITVYGGWADAGRDQQAYTVLYSTVVNPTVFHVLGTVNYNPDNPNGGTSVTRSMLTPATGAMAVNVAAVKFDFTFPTTENGFAGYGKITVGGYLSGTPAPEPVITQENQTNTFTWTVETPNLIAHQLPSSYGPGVFTLEGCNVTNLTDGVIGFGYQFGASCGADTGAVQYVVFTAAAGWDLTNIVVYSLWNDYGRDGQFYDVSYATLAAPTTWIKLANVAFNPDVPHDGRHSGNRVAISPQVGQTLLAGNVAAVKFDFTSQQSEDFAWSGYSEIVLQGSALGPVPVPSINPVKMVNGNLILTGSGGAFNTGYSVVTATNLTTPLINWTVSATGTTDGTGAFSNAIPVSASQPGGFYRLRVP